MKLEEIVKQVRYNTHQVGDLLRLEGVLSYYYKLLDKTNNEFIVKPFLNDGRVFMKNRPEHKERYSIARFYKKSQE